MSTHLTDRLADWAVTTTYEDLPESVVHAAKRSIVDSLGCMAGGSGHGSVDILLASLGDVFPDGPLGRHMIVGRSGALDIVNATLVNGVMAHVLDFDDTILPTRCHISAPMLSSLLATAERVEASGKDVITAFTVGFELVTRSADAVYDGKKGWHGTGVMGPLGVGAAVGRLLGLDQAATAQAFALGANQASGIRASFGSMAKAWNLGRAGANGLQAAILASKGYTGGWNVLDAGAGFYELFTDEPAYDILTDDLGERWAIERNGFKPHPCGFVAHAAIDAVVEARSKQSVDPTTIEEIRLTVCPETMVLTSKQQPATGLEGKFSVFHSAAAAYLDGVVTPETYTDGVVADERYRALAAKVTATPDPDYGQGEARVEIIAPDGTTSAYVANALGTDANPMSDAQLQEKYERMATPVFGSGTQALAETVWKLEQHDASDMLRHMSSTA